MTGLDTDNDFIIEIATIITDSELNILEEGPVAAIHQPDFILNKMSEIKNLQSMSGNSKNNIAMELSKYAINKGSYDNVSIIIAFLS